MCFRAIKILLLLSLSLPGLVWGAAAVIGQEQLWSGQVDLSAPVRVNPDAVLIIEAGTVVTVSDKAAGLSIRGQLLILGTEVEPVVFKSPADWKGIEFIEAAAGSRIEHAQFSGCGVAVSVIATAPQIRNSRFVGCQSGVELLREADALIENNYFTENQSGLKIGQKSKPQVLSNRFVRNQKSGAEINNGSGGLFNKNLFSENGYGLVLQKKFSGEIRNNDFINNKIGLYTYQTQNTPLIDGNLFQGNENGMLAFSFSYPLVRNNRFIDNRTAINNDQFGSARIEHNLFRRNDTALFNNRKSNPEATNNQFEENALVLFCDYSSYPLVKQNNFLGNKKVAELGLYQSADWEQRAGSKKLIQQQAQARNSRNPLLAELPTEFTDQLDLRGNWWGEQTEQLRTVGIDANLDILFDRRDRPEVTYPGYGDARYRLDLIIYADWLDALVDAAGPLEKR